MDYEKEYKNLVAKVKKAHQFAQTDSTKSVLEDILPELRESEDERIRKYIINFVNLEKEVNLPPDDADRMLDWLEKKKEQKPTMIQWTGKNLKEVIDFTGKSQKFGEWFKSWEDFANYVHSHDDIIKLFCEDGSHYEVPVGAWIVKTPDGYNTPSRFRFIQKPAEWRFPYGKDETVDKLIAIAECLEMDGDELFNGYKGTECGKLLRDLARKQVACTPAEWSEDDEKIREALYKHFSVLYPGDSQFRDTKLSNRQITDFLKALRPSWKPTMEQISMVTCVCNGLHMQNNPDAEGMDELLKQLEKIYWNVPIEQWKPSDEQMKALEQAKISAVVGNYITKDGLCSLYEQLRKLIQNIGCGMENP